MDGKLVKSGATLLSLSAALTISVSSSVSGREVAKFKQDVVERAATIRKAVQETVRNGIIIVANDEDDTDVFANAGTGDDCKFKNKC